MTWAACTFLCQAFILGSQSPGQPASPAGAATSALAGTLAEDLVMKAVQTAEYDRRYEQARLAFAELLGHGADWREYRTRAVEFVEQEGGLLHIQFHRDWFHTPTSSAQELKAAYTRLVVLIDDDHPYYAVALHYLGASCYKLGLAPGASAGEKQTHLAMALHYEQEALGINPTFWPAYANMLAILEQSGVGADSRSVEDALKFLTATLPPWDRAVQRFLGEEKTRCRFGGVGQVPPAAARVAHGQPGRSCSEAEPVFRLQSFFDVVRRWRPGHRPAPVPWRLSWARKLKADGKTREAIDCCLAMIRSDPGLGEPYVLLASLYRLTGKGHRAVETEYRMGLFGAKPGNPAQPD